MTRPVPSDDHEREFLEIVDKHGWHVMLVSGDESGPSFAYSTGIYERLRRAEVIVFGLESGVAHWLVNEYGARAAAGMLPSVGNVAEGFLDEASVMFLDVEDETARGSLTTWTTWYYQSQDYPLVQAVWPDKKTGAFPWQEGFQSELRVFQPLLCFPADRH